MIFNISMTALGKQGHQLMPFNYHYPLSTAIHSAIYESNKQFASFLHEVGYGSERYKLFTFSDIVTPFATKGDRMLLLTDHASFKVCFQMPEAAEHFIKGLFVSEEIKIADKVSHVRFKIQKVDACPYNISGSPEDVISAIVQPISPLVVSCRRAEKSKPSLYVSPYELAFVDRLIFSWLQKYKAISPTTDIEMAQLREKIKVEILFFPNPPAERRIIIEKSQESEQKVRGYTKFRMRLTAPKKMIDLALNSGLGVRNSIGMGCIQLIN